MDVGQCSAHESLYGDLAFDDIKDGDGCVGSSSPDLDDESARADGSNCMGGGVETCKVDDEVEVAVGPFASVTYRLHSTVGTGGVAQLPLGFGYMHLCALEGGDLGAGRAQAADAENADLLPGLQVPHGHDRAVGGRSGVDGDSGLLDGTSWSTTTAKRESPRVYSA